MRIRLVLTIFIAAGFVGCADSEFEGVGKRVKNVGLDQSKKKSDYDAEGEDVENQQDYDVNASGELDERGESADAHQADFDEQGCKMPKDIKADSAKSFDLGWGSTGVSTTEASLRGLDVRDCDWFESVHNTAARPLMLVYTDENQSYAEPFNAGFGFFGKSGGSQDAPCHNAARAMQTLATTQGMPGRVVCSLVPKKE